MYGPPLIEQLRMALDANSAGQLLALMLAMLLSALSAVVLLGACVRQIARRKGGYSTLMVVLVEQFGVCCAPMLGYVSLGEDLARFGAGIAPLPFMLFMWCPAAFLLVLTTIVNVTLTIHSVRSSRVEPA